ncbi:MAG: ABC transporter ATP-binding protein, partial [Patescibacteria group bacterium]
MTKRSIYLVEAPTQYALASTFLRFQEHYESPKFRGQFFSLEEFMDWYAEEYGNFTYYKDWTGFNIPSYILKSFR